MVESLTLTRSRRNPAARGSSKALMSGRDHMARLSVQQPAGYPLKPWRPRSELTTTLVAPLAILGGRTLCQPATPDEITTCGCSTTSSLRVEDTSMRYSNSIGWIAGGEESPSGLSLQIDWRQGEAVADVPVPSATQAAPGIAHGGFLAALADHVMGFVAAQQGGRPAVTRRMTVDYLAPTPTSQVITIRARAESVTERAVTVRLEGIAKESGQVTFKAHGDYARVSPARRDTSSTEVDYDTLEERFDPSQTFAWLAAALKDAFAPGTTSSPLVIAVEVTDARPRQWMFTTAGRSLDIEPGDPAECDVRFVGSVRSLRDLVYRRKTADQLVAAGSATVEDPTGLLSVFLACLAT